METIEKSLWEEKRELRKVYDTIADSWTHLRAQPLQEVKEFSYSIEKKGLVLDIGCSNCRNLVPFLQRKFPCVGLDFSKNMVREAKKFLLKRNLSANLLIGDASNLPFKNDAFDYILYTRALHHLPARSLRIKSLKGVKMIAKEKGQIIITVWRRYYPRFLIDIISNIPEKKFEFGDTYKKWTYHGKVYKRFYHLYSLGEFENELKEAGIKVDLLFISNGNIIARCEK